MIHESMLKEDELLGIEDLGEEEMVEETVEEEPKMSEFEWMQKAVSKLANDFHKEFPKAAKKEWKYFLFNTVHW